MCVCVCVFMYLYERESVCVCVCEREREKERDACVRAYVCMHECMHVSSSRADAAMNRQFWQ